MDVWQKTNWFVVQTKPHHENLVSASLAKLNLEVFLPRIRRDQAVCGVTRLVTKPLFTGYFFARFCPLLSLDAVRYARGVLRVLRGSHGPIPIPLEIISEIRDRVRPDGFITLDSPAFRRGQQVTIEQGPFEGLLGEVEQEWDDGKRVSILLEAISRARVLIEKRWLAWAPVF
jgi:transcriptional antiterminator RfaH